MNGRLNVLLLQARRVDDPMIAQEHACFVRSTGLPADRLVGHNVCSVAPTLAAARRHDAVMVGGSGDYYISRGDLPNHESFLEVLAGLAELGHPTFASCFGYQGLVQALGGEVAFDPDRTELGSYELKLSRAGRADALFGQLPERFIAQMGHKDRAMRHPPDLPALASSALCPLQALRIPGKPVWASQFHPELDCATNLERFDRYIEGYSKVMNGDELLQARERFVDSPEADTLLQKFLDLVFG